MVINRTPLRRQPLTGWDHLADHVKTSESSDIYNDNMNLISQLNLLVSRGNNKGTDSPSSSCCHLNMRKMSDDKTSL